MELRHFVEIVDVTDMAIVYSMAQIYRYMDVMIASHFIVGDHNVDVSIDLGHSVKVQMWDVY